LAAASAKSWFSQRVVAWAARRQGIDPVPVTLQRRRIYILPTRQGLLYAVSVLAMLLASLNYNNNLGLLLTFLLAGVGLVALYRSQHNLAGLVVHVRPAPPVFAGDELCFPVQLRHDGRHRYAIGAPGTFVDVPGGRGTTIRIGQKTRHRGSCALRRFSLSTTFPLGLFRAWVWIDSDIHSVVWPRPAAIAAQPAPVPAAESASGTLADGDDDFAGLRAWREGDPIRHVDWNALARGRGLMTKQFAGGPPALDHYDLDALSGLPLETALSRLARSVLDADAEGARYSLRVGDRTLGPDSGTVHKERCLMALALYGP
jgi:uncharacterized protein (DUF58 family)